MNISVFDMFSIGIGPSSSHTVGPMRAANAFIAQLLAAGLLTQVTRVQVNVYGSLALTGKGHGTDLAIINGLLGQTPEQVDPASVKPAMQQVIQTKRLILNGEYEIPFEISTDLCLLQHAPLLPLHSNGMHFFAYQDDAVLLDQIYYSIGGGFIMTDKPAAETQDEPIPYPFDSAKTLLNLCQQHKLTIAELMWANEQTWRKPSIIRENLLAIANTMLASIDAGCQHDGILPGGLEVKRRAPNLYKKLKQQTAGNTQTAAMNWLSCYAIAVNEENAAGGRVVTAPTNGAAGIIPAVLKYYLDACAGDEQGICDYLLTAAAIGILYKQGASISAAEVGCQGEVGVACSMAAGALTAVLGGNIFQVENAAEIGMEHHLGLTCDPIGGLVQIPCIERNAMGAVQAVNTAQLALLEDGEHKVSLDSVIATMLQTGKDMQSRYKETALGGLATKSGISVNLPEC